MKTTRNRREVTVAGQRPRPLAIDIVEGRLIAMEGRALREKLGIRLAETCYECFSVEELFRELINRDPIDVDGLLTSLVNLDIQLSHINQHWRRLKAPLNAAIQAYDHLLTRRKRTSRRSAIHR